VNFGACYGQGARGLVESAWKNSSIAMTNAEATQWLAQFEAEFPQFPRWRREHYWRCEDRQCILIGRDAARGIGREYPYSRLPKDEHGRRVSAYTRCCNLPIQGACADASMIALIAIDRALVEAGIKGGPVAWLHDEIVLEVPCADAEKAAGLLKRAMVSAFEETFPSASTRGLVEPHIGRSWDEAKGK
jgi:DNA polymerase I-like protein with 3'-5' exonuclease and polymerase domains